MTDGASMSFETGGPRPQNRMTPARASAGPTPLEKAAEEVGPVSDAMVRESDVTEPYGALA